MCQILILTNTNRVKDPKRLANVVAEHLQETQRDGFGYSILGKQGLFGERTVRDKFQSRLESNLRVMGPFVKETYNSFGKVSQCFGGGIFHGRTSTNHKTLINTHPINKHDWSLIHNGVVTNLGPDYSKHTTNDTEDVLHHLVSGGIKAIEGYISGYYAVGAIDPKGNLHVIKDSTAKLYVAMNKTLGCLMFGTTETLIKDISKSMKYTIGPIEVVKDDIYMIFDKYGELTSHTEFKPKGYSIDESKYMSQSLGESDLDLYGSHDYVGEGWPTTEVKNVNESLEAYQEEIDNLDGSYTFFDWNNRPMSLEEFRQLDEVTKLDCLVIRGDGTIVDPQDYYTERIA